MITSKCFLFGAARWMLLFEFDLAAQAQTNGSSPVLLSATNSSLPVSTASLTKSKADAEAQPIDLTEFYGKASGTEGDSWFSHPDWKIVPKGLQNFGGILFDISGTLLLRSQPMPRLKAAVRDIPIKHKCRYIHLLHGLGYGSQDGTTIAVMEIHYANGQQREFPIILGVHVRNWWKEKTETVSTVSDPMSAVAWSGQGTYPPPERASVRLFR